MGRRASRLVGSRRGTRAGSLRGHPEGSLAGRRAQALARALAAWYEANARDLPWRRRRDPYAIWVSEIMLQQTRVEVVARRYEEFLTRFPTLADLARATPADVLAAWAGLGYYRRARSLHSAAQQIATRHGGRLPGSAAGLRLLPGFGAYTAGAVASIAFDEAVAAIDGNVERVLSRLLALDSDPSRGGAAAAVRAAAAALLAHARPSVLNQALMELGARVCTPRAPRCGVCPWARSCVARRSGVPETFPRRPPRPPSIAVACYAAVLREGDALLWRRRPQSAHNAGLWELPTTAWHAGPADPAHAQRTLAELSRELGARWTVGEPLATIYHSITRHRVTVVGHRVTVAGGRSTVTRGGDLRWATLDDAQALGLTAAARKLARKLPTLL
jgi:A/G-specific adenine glycosylase